MMSTRSGTVHGGASQPDQAQPTATADDDADTNTANTNTASFQTAPQDRKINRSFRKDVVISVSNRGHSSDAQDGETPGVRSQRETIIPNTTSSLEHYRISDLDPQRVFQASNTGYESPRAPSCSPITSRSSSITPVAPPPKTNGKTTHGYVMLKLPYPAFEDLLKRIPQAPPTHAGRFIPNSSLPLNQRLRAYSIRNATWTAATASQGLTGLPKNILDRIFDYLLICPTPIHLQRKSPQRQLAERSLPSHQALIVSQTPTYSTDTDGNGINTASPTNLFFINWDLFSRAAPLYYGTNTFRFNNCSNLLSWAISIRDGRHFVKSIILEVSVDVTFAGPTLEVQNLRVRQTGGVLPGETVALTGFPNLARLEIQAKYTLSWSTSHADLRYGYEDSELRREVRKMCWRCVKSWAKSCCDENKIMGNLPGGGAWVEIKCFSRFEGHVKDQRPVAQTAQDFAPGSDEDADDEGESAEPKNKGRKTSVAAARERKETDKGRVMREVMERKQMKQQAQAEKAGQKSKQPIGTHEAKEKLPKTEKMRTAT